jgi:uncharacterized protein (TIGR02118 family)
MYQLIALFRTPADTLAFDSAYADLHLPLARKIPGLKSLAVSRFHPGKDEPGRYYQMAVLSFADREAFKAAMKSPENAEAGKNLEMIAPGLVEFFTAETLEGV